MKKLILTLTLLAATTVFAAKPFTYNDIARGLFAQKAVNGIRSMSDGLSYTTLENGNIVKHRYSDGAVLGVIVDKGTLSQKIKITDYQFSSDNKLVMLTTNVKPIYRHSFTADFFVYNTDTKELKQLSPNGAQQVATFSPDNSMAAFVRDNNLYVVDLKDGNERQITTDGKFNEIINGNPDWVYEEEYALFQGYQWSPDSKRIAYYRFDESRVKTFGMSIFSNQLYPTTYSYKYPKAGEQNAIVSIYCHDLAQGKATKIDVGDEDNQYIPRIMWTPKGELALCRVNRLQNHFELLLAASNGSTRVIYDEKDPQYVNRIDDETVTFLPDGDQYMISSEKDGFRHLYLYSIAKGFLNQITKGAWEVTEIKGYDPKSKKLYFMSCEESPLVRNLYSIKLNGKDKKRITTDKGTYRIDFSNNFAYFISHFSNTTTPNTVTLHLADGKQLRTLENNDALKARVKEYDLPKTEFFTIKNSAGVEMNAFIIKPHGFDSLKKYPVFMTQYSGPGSQQVADRWGVSWEAALVQEGYIVVCVDPRGTGFRGAEFRKCTYRNLGYLECSDQIDAAKYLGTLPYVDAARIGIYGWSYGGFMALNCILKGNDVFKMAIAVAPVTSWRFYDSIYTEIYNGLPQDNPEGYDQNSPIFFADRLKGKLLIAHGTADDNVHVQNTMEMTDRLTRAGKDFDMLIYSDNNHSMYPTGRDHLMRHCITYVKTNL